MTPELTVAIKISLLVLLIVAAVAASVMKKLVPALIVFTSFSLIMALVWILLESPDLAITEAAVGAGVSGVLFYMALRRMGQMKKSFIEKDGADGSEKGENDENDRPDENGEDGEHDEDQR